MLDWNRCDGFVLEVNAKQQSSRDRLGQPSCATALLSGALTDEDQFDLGSPISRSSRVAENFDNNLMGNKPMRYANLLRSCVVVLTIAGATASCAVTSGQETTGEYIDDATISTKVRASLINQLGVTGIGVETLQNVVQLSGFVTSQEIKTEAGQIALNTTGVKGVRNDLTVQ